MNVWKASYKQTAQIKTQLRCGYTLGSRQNFAGSDNNYKF